MQKKSEEKQCMHEKIITNCLNIVAKFIIELSIVKCFLMIAKEFSINMIFVFVIFYHQ